MGSKRWVQTTITETLLFFQARLRAQHGAENRQPGQEVGRKEKGSKFYYKQNQPHDLQVPVQKEKVGGMVQRVFRRSSEHQHTEPSVGPSSGWSPVGTSRHPYKTTVSLPCCMSAVPGDWVNK